MINSVKVEAKIRGARDKMGLCLNFTLSSCCETPAVHQRLLQTEGPHLQDKLLLEQTERVSGSRAGKLIGSALISVKTELSVHTAATLGRSDDKVDVSTCRES